MTASTLPKSPADSAYAALMQHSDLQFSFPGFEVPKPPKWLEMLVRMLGKHWTILGWICWIVVALIVLGALVALIMQFWPIVARRLSASKPAVAEQESLWRPTAAQARELLQESDSLAAQGRFAEAVHLLLLRSIEDIERRRPRLLRPTLTSREIGLLQAIPNAARAAFSSLARVVERARFADLPISAAEFQTCRNEYESFALPPNWQSAQ
jgi:hypothetical protein